MDLFRKNPKKEVRIPDIIIDSLSELFQLIEHLKPDNKSPDAKSIIIDSAGTDLADQGPEPSFIFEGKIQINQESSQPTVRRTLLDGFEMVKRRLQLDIELKARRVDEELYGGFLPPKAPSAAGNITWLDSFIERRLGGKRDGLTIIWELSEGKYRMDPWSCKLEKIDAKSAKKQQEIDDDD